MIQLTPRNIAYTLLIAILSMVAFWIGLFSAGMIVGFLSTYEPHKVEVVKYVERPAGVPSMRAPAEAASAPSSPAPQ